tara:strand:+ start:658 stop:954 length:297 start_codon:yes stop_codon:yes gene_type:complete
MRIRITNRFGTNVNVDVENSKNIEFSITKRRTLIYNRKFFKIRLESKNGDNLSLDLNENQLEELSQLFDLYNKDYKDKNCDSNTSKLETIISDERGHL